MFVFLCMVTLLATICQMFRSAKTVGLSNITLTELLLSVAVVAFCVPMGFAVTATAVRIICWVVGFAFSWDLAIRVFIALWAVRSVAALFRHPKEIARH